jgi:hypothetical protein
MKNSLLCEFADVIIFISGVSAQKSGKFSFLAREKFKKALPSRNILSIH